MIDWPPLYIHLLITLSSFIDALKGTLLTTKLYLESCISVDMTIGTLLSPLRGSPHRYASPALWSSDE